MAVAARPAVWSRVTPGMNVPKFPLPAMFSASTPGTVPPTVTGVLTSSPALTTTVSVALPLPPLPSETVTFAVYVPAAV